MSSRCNTKNLRLIQGGLSAKNQSVSRRLIEAYVTDTRLMGACCIKAHWRIEDCPQEPDFIQFFYFDWQEFGLDSYESLRGS